MKVLINTDRNIHTDEDKERRIEGDLANALERFAGDLTRVEAHLSDESAGRGSGDDIRCLLEARPAGQDPVTVSHQATNETEALGGATDKLVTLLSHKFDRITDKHRHDTIRHH